MSVTSTPFFTALFEHRVPGPRANVAAIAYNLQYTKALVDDFVAAHPVASTDLQTVRFGEVELIRANLFGVAPGQRRRRICVIGVGDAQDRAVRAAHTAWYDFHASVLFSDRLGPAQTFSIVIHRPVPGLPPQRATTVGVLYDLAYLEPMVKAAVARNAPTNDDYEVVQLGDYTLMRVNLYGTHPLESNRRIGVGGVADRHYRGVAAAEQAWAKYHATLLFGAQALAAS